MTSKLIRLSDDTLIEVDASENEIAQLSSAAADKVSAKFDAVRPLLVKACASISEAWHGLAAENVTQAEVELSFGFEAEGSVFLAKTKGTGNMKVKLTFGNRSTK
jgi:hypothetical protein